MKNVDKMKTIWSMNNSTVSVTETKEQKKARFNRMNTLLRNVKPIVIPDKKKAQEPKESK